MRNKKDQILAARSLSATIRSQYRSSTRLQRQSHRSLFDAHDQVDKQREELIAVIEGKLDQVTTMQQLFTLRRALLRLARLVLLPPDALSMSFANRRIASADFFDIPDSNRGEFAIINRSQPEMKTLLVVFHSVTGGTEQMVRALVAGAVAQDGVTTRLLHASVAQPADVLAADAYVFATPENLAAISGLMKDFFDRCYYPALDRINGRAYATLVCAGSDGRNAVRQIERIATGWRLRPVAEAMIVCTHAQTPEEILAPKTIVAEDLDRCRNLGATLAAGLEMGVF